MKLVSTLPLLGHASFSKVLLTLFFVNLCYAESFAFPDTLWVSSRSAATVTGPVLLNGVSYEIEVTGTHTRWGPGDWSQGACSGSEPIAIFPNGSNTQVGRDVYFRFGGPTCCTNCPIPLGSHNDVRFSINTSVPLTNFNNFAGPLTYSPTHQYTSTITGQGQVIRVQFFDSLLSDNSGRYRIVIREASQNPIPTISQWGLIITGLIILCLGGIALHRRSYGKALEVR